MKRSNMTMPDNTQMKSKAITPPSAFDDKGRVIARFGSPCVDGTIDDIWNIAGVIVPNIKSCDQVKANGEFRILWDDNALYTLFIIKDPVLNKDSMNAYEQDSVELFLDELNDKAISYQSDDVHYRVNYKNTITADVGDEQRFYTETKPLTDDSGKVIGYIIEASLSWNIIPQNDTIMGFDLLINDADSAGKRIGTINIFDHTGTVWSTPASMGEIILKGKMSDSITSTNFNQLTVYVKYIENFNPEGYTNFNILTIPLSKTKIMLDERTANQADVDALLAALKECVRNLDDGSGFANVEKLKPNKDLTNPFTFINGDVVKTPADWTKRSDEILRLYEYYMYGVMPDHTKEKVTYHMDGTTMTITVEKDGKNVSFPVSISLPDKDNVTIPKDGYPVLMVYLGLAQTKYANDRGYAVITLDTNLIASDDISRKGVFYELYPYGNTWTQQTGALAAWSWGISRILDALEGGAGTELNINYKNSIMTGVSRWGKSAALAGAFDKRIKVTAPSCSGSGGIASFRYKSEGRIYDYSSIGVTEPHTTTANEALGNLQSSGAKHWFNDNFLKFKDANCLPFDQHLLASLCADKDRYIFITGSYLHEDWINPTGMWASYVAATPVYKFLGISDHIAIHFHKEGHMVTDEDLIYLLDFCDYNFYDKKVTSDLEDLKKSLYLEEKNYDTFFNRYLKDEK